ncbi:hypothetical protein ZWY2020_058023 [Hordeum vulgare]|nr:hypothetical protein ZWY2020_058023 [Hordeum vulgare]
MPPPFPAPSPSHALVTAAGGGRPGLPRSKGPSPDTCLPVGLFRREAKIVATTQFPSITQMQPSSNLIYKALDFVVSEAKRYKMRLILSLCNNWEDYEGKARYVRWGKEAGVDLTSNDDFFSDPTLKGYYKAFVEAVLSRINTITNEAYKDDPTILCLGAD